MKTAINILSILYVVTAHAMSKISIVLGDNFDRSLLLFKNANAITLVSSTYMGALAKLLFAFSEGWNIRLTLIILFLSLAVCCYLCFNANDPVVFVVSRTLQGLFAGVLNSIIIGLMGKYNRSGFSLMAGVSALTCFSTVILLSFLPIRTVGLFLVPLNLFAAFVCYFFNLKEDKKERLTFKEFSNYLFNPRIINLSGCCGYMLGIALNLIFRLEGLLEREFFSPNLSFYWVPRSSAVILAPLVPFLVGFILKPLYKNLSLNFLFLLSNICFFLALKFLSVPFLLLAVSLIYTGFLYFQTKASEEVSLKFQDPYASSIVFFSLRTFLTAFTLQMIIWLKLNIHQMFFLSLILSCWTLLCHGSSRMEKLIFIPVATYMIYKMLD